MNVILYLLFFCEMCVGYTFVIRINARVFVSLRVCTAQPFDLCQNRSDRGQKVN